LNGQAASGEGQEYDDEQNANSLDGPMIPNAPEVHDGHAEALATLSEYLELALDRGLSLIFVRVPGGKNEVYLGDPGEPQADWVRAGVIRESLVGAILAITRTGLNELAIKTQTYRFVRLFSQAADTGAIVFMAT
jgi:hypothetical protein